MLRTSAPLIGALSRTLRARDNGAADNIRRPVRRQKQAQQDLDHKETERMNLVPISDDERRLVFLFRSLASEHERSDLLESLTASLLEKLFPDATLYDFMPTAAGIEPTGSIYDTSSIAHILYCGIEETGDPAVLMGSSHWDEEEAIPRFAYGADRVATEQGSFFNYREDFAREYLQAWRWEIVGAIASQSRETIANSTPDVDT